MNTNFSYTNSYNKLSALFSLDKDNISLSDTDVTIRCNPFHSDNEDKTTQKKESIIINENNDFRYIIFHPPGITKNDRMIILLHGLNERSWSKYLPWAEKLCLETKKSVLLFPIAYHMNRSSKDWLIKKEQFTFLESRKLSQPDLKESSFLNAVLSDRLEKNPERFYTSGLQTYRDILDLVENIKKGNLADFYKNTSIDFFAYSVGVYLAEILLMVNQDQWFSDSRLMIFCGGAALGKTNPLSKVILDSKAVQKLISFFKNITDKKHKSVEETPEAFYFKSLVDDSRFTKERIRRFDEIGERIKAIALQQDKVIPANSVVKTLPHVTLVEDFEYPYKHEMPFPVLKNEYTVVDSAFDRVFGKAAEHLL